MLTEDALLVFTKIKLDKQMYFNQQDWVCLSNVTLT